MSLLSTGSVLPILIVYALAVPLPGPSFVAIARACLEGGARAGTVAGLGTTVGVVIYATATLLGLSLLLAALPGLALAIQIAGGAYLVYLGLGTLRSLIGRPQGTSAPVLLPDAEQQSYRRVFCRSVLVSCSNPKIAIFFASLFAPVVGQSYSTAAGWLALVGIVLIDLVYHQTLVGVLSVLSASTSAKKASRLLDGIAGSLMTAFGARLVVTALRDRP